MEINEVVYHDKISTDSSKQVSSCLRTKRMYVLAAGANKPNIADYDGLVVEVKVGEFEPRRFKDMLDTQAYIYREERDPDPMYWMPKNVRHRKQFSNRIR